MVLNKRAQGIAIFAGIMTFIIVFAAVINLIPSLKIQINQARNADHLDCANTSISVGEKGSCILVDLQMPYFIAIVLSTAAGFIVGNRLKRQ